jgi:hypothetical protein
MRPDAPLQAPNVSVLIDHRSLQISHFTKMEYTPN